MEKKISRRNFLKVLGATGVTAAGLTSGPFIIKARGEQPIKWGHINTLTGEFAPLGTRNRDGIIFGVEDINKKGGILGRKVELIIRDDQLSVETAIRRANELKHDQNVDLITGGTLSSVNYGLRAWAGKNKVLHVHMEQDPPTLVKACNRYGFDTDTIQSYDYATAKGVARRNPEIKRYGGLVPDYAYGHETWDNTRKILAQEVHGFVDVGTVATPLGEKVFTPHLLKLLDMKVEGVFTSHWAGDLERLILQGRDIDFFKKIKLIMTSSPTCDVVALTLKDRMVEIWGAVQTTYATYPEMKEFRQGYMARFNEFPIGYAGKHYQGAYIIKKAIEKAGTTETEAVINALEGLTFSEIGNCPIRLRAEDHLVEEERYGVGITKPSKEYGIWVTQEIQFIPGKECNMTREQSKALGCQI